MAIFRYQGRNANGQKVNGTLDAISLNDTVSFLKNNGIIPLSIERVEKESLLKKLFKTNQPITLQKIKKEDILNFCRQMSTLVAAGVPALDALRQLSLSTPSKPLANAIGEVANSIIAGRTLAASMREHTKIFPPIFVNIIDVGENTGKLDEAFMQLATYLEVSITNRKRMMTTIRYPITVVTAILVAIIVMNILVIPKFKYIFSHFGANLPTPTLILVATSDFMVNHWPFLVFCVVALFIAIPKLLLVPKIRFFWDKYKLHIPIFGNLQQRIILSQFTWTLSLILRAGVPIIRGIALSANATGNAYFTRQILTIGSNIEQGSSFHQAASLSKLFPGTVLQMISIGEETGKLDELLTEVSRYYEREVDYDIKRLNDLVEPILLAGVGALVLLLALGIYLPMWDLIKAVKM